MWWRMASTGRAENSKKKTNNENKQTQIQFIRLQVQQPAKFSRRQFSICKQMKPSNKYVIKSLFIDVFRERWITICIAHDDAAASVRYASHCGGFLTSQLSRNCNLGRDFCLRFCSIFNSHCFVRYALPLMFDQPTLKTQISKWVLLPHSIWEMKT